MMGPDRYLYEIFSSKKEKLFATGSFKGYGSSQGYVMKFRVFSLKNRLPLKIGYPETKHSKDKFSKSIVCDIIFLPVYIYVTYKYSTKSPLSKKTSTNDQTFAKSNHINFDS